jgi:hypothetical protein
MSEGAKILQENYSPRKKNVHTTYTLSGGIRNDTRSSTLLQFLPLARTVNPILYVKYSRVG